MPTRTLEGRNAFHLRNLWHCHELLLLEAEVSSKWVLRGSVWQDVFSRLNRNPKWCRLRYFERNIQNTPPRKTWRNGPVRITLKTSWTFQIWFCLSCFFFWAMTHMISFASVGSNPRAAFCWKPGETSRWGLQILDLDSFGLALVSATAFHWYLSGS